MKVWFRGDGNGRNLNVSAIEITSNKWAVSGVAVGANIKNVQTKLGTPQSRVSDSGETVFEYALKNSAGNIFTLAFREDKLVRMGQYDPGC